MKKKKFLTVYAVLDSESQKILADLQNQILKEFPSGSQTMGIPFHISLGSFPVEKKDELILRMKNLKNVEKPSFIYLTQLNHFNHQVIFVQPELTEELKALHNEFAGNYADGFSWQPHVTLYCGEEAEGIEIEKKYLFLKRKAQIIGLELGEFFPPNILYTISFQ